MHWLVGVTLGKRPSPLDQIELFNCPTLFDISVVHDVSSGLNGAVSVRDCRAEGRLIS